MNDIRQAALEMRKALQMFVGTLDVETQLEKILAIPSVFPAYEVGREYREKEVLSYGVNSVGDPQLYQVLQNHTSEAEWPPSIATSLYKQIGITSDGYPEWVQPLGASDAYSKGDIVSYKGKLYRSIVDANVWSPEANASAWEVAT